MERLFGVHHVNFGHICMLAYIFCTLVNVRLHACYRLCKNDLILSSVAAHIKSGLITIQKQTIQNITLVLCQLYKSLDILVIYQIVALCRSLHKEAAVSNQRVASMMPMAMFTFHQNKDVHKEMGNIHCGHGELMTRAVLLKSI